MCVMILRSPCIDPLLESQIVLFVQHLGTYNRWWIAGE